MGERIRTGRRAAQAAGLVAKKIYESDIQADLFDYLKLIRVSVLGDVGVTNLREYAYAIPNGQDLAGGPKQMASLKKQGLTPGVSDFAIAYPAGPWHGFYLELKRDKDSTITKEQKCWAARMTGAGYYAGIRVGFDAAKQFIDEYVKIIRVHEKRTR